jgi:hypothetical protein
MLREREVWPDLVTEVRVVQPIEGPEEVVVGETLALPPSAFTVEDVNLRLGIWAILPEEPDPFHVSRRKPLQKVIAPGLPALRLPD